MSTQPNKLRYLLVIIVSFILLCVGLASAHASKVIAIVNGKSISQENVDMILQSFKKEAAQQGQAVPDNVEENVREHLIQRTVNTQQAKRFKLHLTPEYNEKLEDARAAILTQLLFEHYKSTNQINDAAVRQEYDRIAAEAAAHAQKEYHARHILVKDQDQANEILMQLETGADFATLAKEHSIDTGTAEQGGDLNWSVAGNYVPAFGEALAGLEKGQITQTPIETDFGYHIIKLEDTRTTPIPEFDLVKEQIKQQLQQKTIGEDFKQYLQELREKAHVSVSVAQK